MFDSLPLIGDRHLCPNPASLRRPPASSHLRHTFSAPGVVFPPPSIFPALSPPTLSAPPHPRPAFSFALLRTLCVPSQSLVVMPLCPGSLALLIHHDPSNPSEATPYSVGMASPSFQLQHVLVLLLAFPDGITSTLDVSSCRSCTASPVAYCYSALAQHTIPAPVIRRRLRSSPTFPSRCSPSFYSVLSSCAVSVICSLSRCSSSFYSVLHLVLCPSFARSASFGLGLSRACQ